MSKATQLTELVAATVASVAAMEEQTKLQAASRKELLTSVRKLEKLAASMQAAESKAAATPAATEKAAAPAKKAAAAPRKQSPKKKAAAPAQSGSDGDSADSDEN